MKLYKYLDISKQHNVDALSNAQLWFANPYTFNDPFDCNLDEIENYSDTGVASYLKNKKLDGRTQAFTLNNPQKLHESAVKKRQKIIASTGVLSLASSMDILLMWAHYANSHFGIVLGFNPYLDKTFFTTMLEMSYCDAYNPINYVENSEGEIERLLTTKHSGWSYEQEFRVIKTPEKIRENKCSRLFHYEKNALTDIYFGLQTKQQDIEKIQNICATNGFEHVKFHQAEKVPHKFELSFKKVF